MEEPVPEGVGDKVISGDSNGSSDDGDDEQPVVHPGATMLGIIMTLSSFYFIYVEEYVFSMYLFALLVVLALGSKYFND